MTKYIYDLVKRKYNLNPEDITFYLYGSRVYGTNNENSDYDVIVLNKKDINNQEIKHDIVNIHIYTKEHFQEMLNEHKIVAMEVFFNNDMKDFSFSLDLGKLRTEISSKSSNSWVKCKKKLTVEPKSEYYIGIKSLFHSLRIIDFGIQIAKNGRIVDYTSSKDLWIEIKSQYWTWDDLNERFKPLYNERMSEFRKLAPKS